MKYCKRTKVYSLDFLMYLQQHREEEKEMIETGQMEPWERYSLSEVQKRFSKELRNHSY